MVGRAGEEPPAPSARGRALQAEAEIRQHLAAIARLLPLLGCDTVAEPPSAPPRSEGPVVGLKQAAAAVGWREDRLRREIVRHNTEHPYDPIGWQAGGRANARWEVPLGRLRRHLRNASGLRDA